MEETLKIQASQLATEHRALLVQYGKVQSRCSTLIAAQAAQLEQLQAQSVCLRAALIARDTALAWERADRLAVEAAIPGLPKRLNLARRVESLMARVHDLMRERLGGQKALQPAPVPTADPVAGCGDLRRKSVLCVGDNGAGTDVAQQVVEMAGGHFLRHDGGGESALLEYSLVAADLVICQTGCVSHDAYWRVQDHCLRTGKQCVLVDQPHVIQLVRGRDTKTLKSEDKTDVAQ